MLSDYKLVFVDDADEDRVQGQWKRALRVADSSPTWLAWPDAILVRDSDKSIWFVDAVTSDGEIDTTRHDEIDDWAKQRGYTPRGYTTAYATWQRAGQRQARMKNLAVDTTI